jgi:hypothetical protein|tara:strand:- start:132 stop:347 length:216 start_codon:yes stop_codon:yes gene_type:complete
MATVTSWTDALQNGVTEVYPFVGTEWIWLLIAVVIWLTWHVKTSARETQEYDELSSKGKGPEDHKDNITNW